MINELQPPAYEPVYLKNTYRFNGFLGAVEIFSTSAVELYSEFGVTGCHDMAENSGEDGYFKGCMDAIGAKFMIKDEILASKPDPNECDAVHAVFHPYKNADKYQRCYNKARDDELVDDNTTRGVQE